MAIKHPANYFVAKYVIHSIYDWNTFNLQKTERKNADKDTAATTQPFILITQHPFDLHPVPGTPWHKPCPPVHALPLPVTTVTNEVIVTQNVDNRSFGD